MLKRMMAACAFALVPAAASADGFARIDGITGDATAVGRKGWMVIDTMTEGVTNTGAASSGSGSGLGKANFSPVTFTKMLDSASPALRDAVAKGKRFPEATIEFVRPGETTFLFYRVSLKDVGVENVDLAIGPDSQYESIALTYREIKWEFVRQNPKGGAGATVSASAVVN